MAFDKEFKNIGDNEEKFYAKKIEDTIVSKLKAFYNVSVIWDTNNLLDKQDSPVDKGKDVFSELWENRIFIQGD